MGIFSRLFGSKSSAGIEKRLEDEYVPIFESMAGMSLGKAKSVFHDLLNAAKEEAQKEGTLNLPLNLGDALLEKEKTDSNIRTRLRKLRKEGVCRTKIYDGG